MIIKEVPLDQLSAIIANSEGKFVETSHDAQSTMAFLLTMQSELGRHFKCFAAFEEDKTEPAGYISTWPLKETIAIGPTFVEEKYRGQGISTALIKYVIDYARGVQGVIGVRSQTWSTNTPMIVNFQKLGFVVRKVVNGDRLDGSDSVQYILNF